MGGGAIARSRPIGALVVFVVVAAVLWALPLTASATTIRPQGRRCDIGAFEREV